MKDTLKDFIRAIGALIRWLIALIGIILMIQMIGEDQPIAALFLLVGALIMLPPTGKKVLGSLKRPWVGLVVAGAMMFVVAPVMSVIYAPSPEEKAAREQRLALAKKESDARDAAREKQRTEEKRQKEEERIRKKCTDDVGAFVMSQSFVKDALRAPATAKFPSFLNSKVTVTSPCSFRVASYVDAQNGFGALIRNRYVADLEVDPLSDRWRLKGLQME